MLPGIDEFYEGMHRFATHEMESALNQAEEAGVHVSGHDGHGHEEDMPAPASSVIYDAVASWGIHAAVDAVCDAALDAASHFDFSSVPLAAYDSHASAALGFHVGTPHGDGFARQTTAFTCAVVSQKMILDQFHLSDPRTGEPISEAQLVYDATSHGWLTDHGTDLGDLNRLLDHYGVASHVGHGWRELIGELAAGHQVVIPVNSHVLWNDHSPLADLSPFRSHAPDHAVVLKGLSADEHGHVSVVINDPGRADGAGVELPLEHFQSSLDAVHLTYVATDHAPPGSEHWTIASSSLSAHIGPDASAHDTFAGHVDGLGDPADGQSVAERYEFLRGI